MYNLIKIYINKLTINDIKEFASKNQIKLSDSELNIIYDTVKKDYELLIKDSDAVFKKVKKKISEENYIKIYNLFNEYKKKYKNYL